MLPGCSAIETSRSTGFPKKALETPRAAMIGTDAVTAAPFGPLLLGEQLVEELLVPGREDVAVGREVLGPREIGVDVAVVDDRQRHLDESGHILAAERLD